MTTGKQVTFEEFARRIRGVCKVQTMSFQVANSKKENSFRMKRTVKTLQTVDNQLITQ